MATRALVVALGGGGGGGGGGAVSRFMTLSRLIHNVVHLFYTCGIGCAVDVVVVVGVVCGGGRCYFFPKADKAVRLGILAGLEAQCCVSAS